MDDADYLREQAVKFRERAAATGDTEARKEFLELAEICEEVAEAIEARAASG